MTAIIGVCDSGFYLASAPIAQDAGIPYLDTGGTVPNLPEQIGEFAHMMPFGDDYQAYVAAEFAMKDLGAKTAFLLRDGDTDYTRAIAAVLHRSASRRTAARSSTRAATTPATPTTPATSPRSAARTRRRTSSMRR